MLEDHVVVWLVEDKGLADDWEAALAVDLLLLIAQELACFTVSPLHQAQLSLFDV